MKKTFRLSWLMILAILSLGMISCSSDDEVVPKLSIPVGNEDYFTKSMDFESSSSEKILTFDSNVAWKLSVADTRDGSNWLAVNPTSGDAGTHMVTVKALENTTYDDRNAVITIVAGDSIRKVFVNQKQMDALTLTSSRFEVPVGGGSINVEVKANIDYEVIIPDEYKTWIHKANGKTRALSTSSLSFTIDKCEEYDKREGQIIIKGKDKEETVTVYQAGEGILTLTKNEYNLSSSAKELAIEIRSNFDYAVDLPNVDWLKEVTAQTRGISTHTLRLAVAENKAYDGRSTKIRIYDRNSSISEEVTINQSQKNELIIDKKEFEFDEKGGSFSVEINSNIDYKVNIGCDWIKKTTATTRALTASSHSFNVLATTGDSDREGTITFSDSKTGISEKIVVKQKRTIFFDSNTLTIMEGAEKKINLTNRTSQGITWSSSNPSIATVDNSGIVKAVSKGNTTITATTEDGQHTCKCIINVKNIIDCVSMARTGTGLSISMYGTRYSVTFTIMNTSSETIHIVSLGGVTDGVAQDLRGGESLEITLASPTSALQSYQQTLLFTYNGKQYSIKG